MTIDSAVDSKISNRTINTNRISNRTYDSKSNRITKLRRSLDEGVRLQCEFDIAAGVSAEDIKDIVFLVNFMTLLSLLSKMFFKLFCLSVFYFQYFIQCSM